MRQKNAAAMQGAEPAAAEQTKSTLCSGNAPWAEFYSNWDDIKVDPAHTIINLSSIIHEIYSYCSPIDVETFWNRICNTGFAYITIRDMFPIPLTPCSKIYRESIIKAGYESELMDFERHWGLVKNTKNLRRCF